MAVLGILRTEKNGNVSFGFWWTSVQVQVLPTALNTVRSKYWGVFSGWENALLL